jgi:hypothetical protein
MASDLLSMLPDAESAIRTAYAQAQKFDYDGSYAINPTDGYVDLAHVAQLLATQQISPTLSVDAQAVANMVTQQVVIHKQVVSGTYHGQAQWDLANANGLSIYMPLGERDCRPTGPLRQDVSYPQAIKPCTAPLAAVGDPIIEPQLSYYTRFTQLHFTADAPEWAKLLLQIDTHTPARVGGDYHLPMPAAPLTRIYLPMIAR